MTIEVAESGRVHVGCMDVITADGADRLVTLRVEPNVGPYVVMTAEKALEVASKLLMRADQVGLI